MNQFILIFLGGGIGSILRFLLSKYVSSNFTHINVLGTLSANLIATSLLAVLIYFYHEKNAIDEAWRLFLITGICGGFSTFSTFSFETYELFRLNMPFYALLNILISVSLGVVIMLILHKVS